MKIIIEKKKRKLVVMEQEQVLFCCSVALGFAPVGNKEKEGDGKTPEGRYFVCLKKRGKYGPSLGISYPSASDALRLGADENFNEIIEIARKECAETESWLKLLYNTKGIDEVTFKTYRNLCGRIQRMLTSSCITIEKKIDNK